MKHAPIAKEIEPNETIDREAIIVNTQDVIYLGDQNNSTLGNDHNMYIDEEVKVREKYCGPITCLFGSILFIVFWPATMFMGCCLCDTRTVNKRRVD